MSNSHSDQDSGHNKTSSIIVNGRPREVIEHELSYCELSASWSHFVFGVMAPVNFRHKGATLCSA